MRSLPCRIRPARRRWLLAKLLSETTRHAFSQDTGARGCCAARSFPDSGGGRCCKPPSGMGHMPLGLQNKSGFLGYSLRRRLIGSLPSWRVNGVTFCLRWATATLVDQAAPFWAAPGASKLRLWRDLAHLL